MGPVTGQTPRPPFKAVWGIEINYTFTRIMQGNIFFTVGLISWVIIYAFSNDIIVQNSFFKYAIFGTGILLASLIYTGVYYYNVKTVLIAAMPLIYILYFRLLLLILFPSYPKSEFPPNLILFGHGQAWRGKSSGVVPTKREKILSYLLLLGSFVIFFSILVITKHSS